MHEWIGCFGLVEVRGQSRRKDMDIDGYPGAIHQI